MGNWDDRTTQSLRRETRRAQSLLEVLGRRGRNAIGEKWVLKHSKTQQIEMCLSREWPIQVK